MNDNMEFKYVLIRSCFIKDKGGKMQYDDMQALGYFDTFTEAKRYCYDFLIREQSDIGKRKNWYFGDIKFKQIHTNYDDDALVHYINDNEEIVYKIEKVYSGGDLNENGKFIAEY